MRRFTKLLSAILVICMAASLLVLPASAAGASMEQKSMQTTQTTVGYWLYTPENATEDMPLIVYLHGGSGKGSDLDKLVGLDGFPMYLYEGTIAPDAYVLIPQMPSSYSTWIRLAVSVKAIIDSVCDTYSIDTSKISLTGHSMGGGGTYELALKYPSLFARIAPLSGRVSNTTANVNTLSDMPIRAFVGSADTTVAPSYTQNFIAAILEANPSADVSCVTISGAAHAEVPGLVYLNEEYDLINWLDFGFETVPEETEPEETVPETTVPEETEPEETVPETTVPEETEPEETVPETTVPEETEPEETVPETTVPEETDPAASVSVSVEVTKKENTNKRSTWTATITAEGDVAKVEYSVKGKKWVEDTTYTATYAIETFYIRVTDSTGTVHSYTYTNGEVIAD